jgi:heme exporter protein D
MMMNCSSRLLCVLYVATSAGLICTAAIAFGHGPVWVACLLVVAGVVPLIAVMRESVIGEQRRRLADEARRKDRGSAVVEWIVQGELDAACCERWWTSLGRDHDPVCRYRLPKGSAA